MTAYSARSANSVGNTLVFKGDGGRRLFEALEEERDAIDAELAAAGHGVVVGWRRRGDTYWVDAVRQFPGAWTIEQEAAQLAWLLGATNTFVNVFRPRVLRHLPRGQQG